MARLLVLVADRLESVARLAGLAYRLLGRRPGRSGRAGERVASHLVFQVLSADVVFFHSPLVFVSGMLVGALISLSGGTEGAVPAALRRAGWGAR